MTYQEYSAPSHLKVALTELKELLRLLYPSPLPPLVPPLSLGLLRATSLPPFSEAKDLGMYHDIERKEAVQLIEEEIFQAEYSKIGNSDESDLDEPIVLEPIILVGDVGSGKTTVLSQWLEAQISTALSLQDTAVGMTGMPQNLLSTKQTDERNTPLPFGDFRTDKPMLSFDQTDFGEVCDSGAPPSSRPLLYFFAGRSYSGSSYVR